MIRKKLQGQAAIISGASRGIGAATARLLAEAGAAVVLAARSSEQLEAVAEDIRRQGGRAIAVPADISDPATAEEIVESALDQFDRVDILVNSAGIIWPLDEALETDVDEWAYSVHVNLIGPFCLTRNVLPVMVDQSYGRIVNLTSAAAGRPYAGMSAYCTAQAGLEMWTRVVAQEVAGRGVGVNCLNPGWVDTELQADIRSVDTAESGLDFDAWRSAYERGELLFPEDVARLVYWLVGPWGRMHSGEVFCGLDEAWRSQVEADLGK
jgi:3-oxoacyl-[acyl-carrier protein] reductase